MKSSKKSIVTGLVLALIVGATLVMLISFQPVSSDKSTNASGPTKSTKSTGQTKGLHIVAKYPEHKDITASIYGIGEKATVSNGFVSNAPSAWSSDATKEFGGIDQLNSSAPRSFEPRHNTYYAALPAGEYTEKGLILNSREKSPWASEIKTLPENSSLFKGRWIRVSRNVNGENKSIYVQWQDVGPSEVQDYDYVFGDGSTKPKNTFGVKAGIDLSPDAASELGFGMNEGSAVVGWSFVDRADVEDGPWLQFPSIDNKMHW